ncbi:E3 ubiquitin-protein ligase hrd1 [Collariella sp. IMI 366227]|nr:E3 ubiquitin-protein ligase hrd1 [Collariella sp. IMI 366227]
MRLAWYAGASTALAGAVVASAFYQRSNFYSAMVHLAQSNFSLMILVNLMFVIYTAFMYGVQRLCFGPLRPTEIEQLYEKAWFAVTETCLAMTVFREEIGAFFLVMFTSLVTGKVWGWIGEGRVEVLEQQPPANPRLFHTRLAISLFVSVAYDFWLLGYAVNVVVQQARPTMMVMFLFEFAILAVSSLHTVSRYIVSLAEQQVVKKQTRQRLEDQRRRVREQRAEILRRRDAGEAGAENEELPDENDVDEMDIEVPGWEAKGQWVLSLDLFADFVKLGIYLAFFCVILTFYGLPIHIMRDLFMTMRSFVKRLHALIRYRQALKHMQQYPDATAEELTREDTCIICREEMRPWDPSDITQVERSRAKKLPCGHILHFGCLKSWLERQQVCPTCRRPVAREGPQPAANGQAVMFRLGLNFPAGQNQQQPPQPAVNGQAPGGGQPAAQGGADDQANVQNRNVRMFNLGPLRLGFAQGGVEEIREMAQRLRVPPDAANPPAPTPTTPAPQENNNDIDTNLDQLRTQLSSLVQQVRQEMAHVHSVSHELQLLTIYMNELTRLRQARQQNLNQQPTQQPAPAAPGQPPLPQGAESPTLPSSPRQH